MAHACVLPPDTDTDPATADLDLRSRHDAAAAPLRRPPPTRIALVDAVLLLLRPFFVFVDFGHGGGRTDNHAYFAP